MVFHPYLDHALHKPVNSELELNDLPVEGDHDICGSFVQIGPNPVFAPRKSYNWFDGDGMVHGICIEGKKARYVRHFVATASVAREKRKGRALFTRLNHPISLPNILALRHGELLKNTGS